jgi:hypothetical protein
MPCFVPKKYKHLRWHVIQPTDFYAGKPSPYFEIAEWVNNNANGPNDRGHWVRWGHCGDFPSLCRAEYVAPFPDQEMLENKLREANGSTWLNKWIGESGACKT